jgi:hypothetical protein
MALERQSVRCAYASAVAIAGLASIGLAVALPVAAADCLPAATALCLQGNRFRAEVTWRTGDGSTGAGHAVPIAGVGDSGLFWFFGPQNLEMLVKVLDACSLNQHYWVYAASATDVELTLSVTDEATGARYQSFHPLGPPAPALTDTNAFATCGAAAGQDRGEAALGGFALDPSGVDTTTLDAATELGVAAVRATPNLAWYANQPQLGGPYSWQLDPANDTADRVQRLVQARGLDTVRILSSARPDDPGKPAAATDPAANFLLSPALRDDWQTFVRAVVERYDGDGGDDMPGLVRRIHRWSYSPEAGTFFVPKGDAAGFDEMFRLTAEAVHEADPTAEVILPLNTQGVYYSAFVAGYLPRSTIVVNGVPYDRAAAQTAFAANLQYTSTLLGGARPDLYDLHLYGDPESIPGRAAWLGAFLRAHGLPVRPLVSFEGGSPFAQVGETFPTGPAACGPGGANENAARLAFQSGALVKHVALALLSGFATVTFNLGPEYADFSTAFGDLDLWTACRVPRPAYWTSRLARQKLLPLRSAQEVANTATRRLLRFTFAPPRGDVWVAWDPSGDTGAQNLAAQLGFDLVRVTHTVAVAGTSEPQVTLEPVTAVVLGPSPVFLEQP